MSYSDYTAEEIVQRGEEFYNRHLRSQLEREHPGHFLILDIESGNYEVDRKDMQASKRLLERHPEGILYGIRIGHEAAYHIGIRFECPLA